jgi:hypothetical protein
MQRIFASVRTEHMSIMCNCIETQEDVQLKPQTGFVVLNLSGHKNNSVHVTVTQHGRVLLTVHCCECVTYEQKVMSLTVIYKLIYHLFCCFT